MAMFAVNVIIISIIVLGVVLVDNAYLRCTAKQEA